MVHRPGTLLRRAKRIRRTEGLASLAGRAFAFVVGHIFQYQTYYLLERNLENVRTQDEADFLPRMEDFTLAMVSSNRQADELEADGLEFRSHTLNARKALDRGAVAFCIFVGRELGSIGWVAMTQEAKDCLGEPPYKIDVLSNQASVAAVWTDPKYRRLGLREYGAFKRHRFMLDCGVRTRRIAILKRNIAFHMGSAKAGSQPYAVGRHLRVLWWMSWKERPLTPQEREATAKRETQRN